MIDIDEEDEDYGVAEQLESHFTKILESNVGDVVFYDFDTNKFSSASVVDGTKISAETLSTWKDTILLGIVINQHKDRTVDVLMCGFLSANPIRPPLSYMLDNKRKYIREYIRQLYVRYISAFFKQCPKYTPLEQMNITLPTVSDMLKVQYFQDTIFDALYHQLDIEQYNKYIKRMFSNYLYVTHKGKIYQMMLNSQGETTEPFSLIYPMAIKADFLCVFRHIDILNID